MKKEKLTGIERELKRRIIIFCFLKILVRVSLESLPVYLKLDWDFLITVITVNRTDRLVFHHKDTKAQGIANL
ncbi:MAG: hypothetical protein COT45_05690 [bacterium (Candidatus Stahlbacteria) CG08_land_8_20_14_0_20_40_26]|nr:MAG: hypothetical protein COX49_05605 [bacterium (Candidatus Stahlbacteria) CG23_combo_of_CG06-09_8_20_14_all_40_9]PIS23615.1 MAG: hypothetical protein COT45_05690 [bacterium (Candidatus Stahlbacteria) CG08_land_8_20_14_0_20_40_26]